MEMLERERAVKIWAKDTLENEKMGFLYKDLQSGKLVKNTKMS